MKITGKVEEIINRSIIGLESTERPVEIPFLLSELPEPGDNNGNDRCKTLDCGCCESYLVEELSKLGFDSYGVDLRDYGQGCKGGLAAFSFKFYKGDIRNMNMFKDETFDIVFAISTIEHVGLVETPYYTDSKLDADGDIKSVQEMLRVLKKGGKIIITIPYGHGVDRLSKWIRFYDKARLDRILGMINVDKVVYKQHCLSHDGRHVWLVSGEKEAYNRWSVWSDLSGIFMGSNVCISGYKN